MKLTPEQFESLQPLIDATGRPDAFTAYFELKGIVLSGNARFGRWVKLTALGREACLAHRAKYRTVVPDPGRVGLERHEGAKVVAKTRIAVFPSGSAPLPLPTAEKQANGSSLSSPKGRSSRPTASKPSAESLEVKAPPLAPNAIRVQTGQRVAYYSISSKGSFPNGTLVVTKNRLFRSTTVEASAADHIVR